MNGLFITFEGPDGSGKTTQIARVAAELSGLGLPIVATREPGGTAISDKIRSIILDPENREMADRAEVLLYAASRAQHVEEKIIPALKEGKIVLCDRFVDASIAYQGHGLGLDVHTVAEVNRFATGGLVPDRTYLIDVPVSVTEARLRARAAADPALSLDRIESKGSEYHERVRSSFHAIAEANPERIVPVRGDRSPDEVFDDIIRDCESLLAERIKR
ncbi:dTMP kinase [Gorillibacterium timonense]|uniref:dTMP kinase n=1 Tax=Gorillibacterium timonense TaxID=1689269 RepID=UPI00071D3CEF|nr:dTMP kinase [Gorillibacterium timonense]